MRATVWTSLMTAAAAGVGTLGTGRMVDAGRPEERPVLLALTGADLVLNASIWRPNRRRSPRHPRRSPAAA